MRTPIEIFNHELTADELREIIRVVQENPTRRDIYRLFRITRWAVRLLRKNLSFDSRQPLISKVLRGCLKLNPDSGAIIEEFLRLVYEESPMRY